MEFRVIKPFKWNEKNYKRGDHINMEEGNPRTEGMHIGGFIRNDATSSNKNKSKE